MGVGLRTSIRDSSTRAASSFQIVKGLLQARRGTTNGMVRVIMGLTRKVNQSYRTKNTNPTSFTNFRWVRRQFL